MIAVCPRDKTHDQFIGSAIVRRGWLMDKHGELIEETQSTETLDWPNFKDQWICSECGAVAYFVESEADIQTDEDD